MKNKSIVASIFALTAAIFLCVTACGGEKSPSEKITDLCDQVIGLIREPTDDISAKKAEIIALWDARKTMIAEIRRELGQKIDQARDFGEKEALSIELNHMIRKLLELRRIMREAGVDL